MTDLGPSSRALLDAARPGLGPSADAARRMRANIALATGAGAAATTTASAVGGTTGSTAALGGGIGIAAKLGIIAALALGAGAIALVATNRSSPPHVVAAPIVTAIAPPASPALVPPPASLPPPPRIAAEIETEMPAVDLSQSSAAARPPVAEPPAQSKHAALNTPSSTPPIASPTKPTSPTPPPTTIALSREVALVDRAMSALKSHDAQAALTVLATYAAESAGRGQLAEDAAAIEVEALCTLHDPAAASHLTAFDTRFPSSAQRTRLTAACR